MKTSKTGPQTNQRQKQGAVSSISAAFDATNPLLPTLLAAYPGETVGKELPCVFVDPLNPALNSGTGRCSQQRGGPDGAGQAVTQEPNTMKNQASFRFQSPTTSPALFAAVRAAQFPQQFCKDIKHKALALMCGLAFTLGGLLDTGAQNLVAPPSLAIANSGANIVLSWTGTEYSLEMTTKAPSDANAVWTPLPGSSPLTLQATGSMGFFRLKKQLPVVQVVRKQTPWAILLCKFKDDQSDPPVADFIPRCQKLFTSAGAGTYNTVQYFQDMSHGKLDLSGSRVFDWLTLDAKVSDLVSGAVPEPPGWNSPARRAKMMTLAKLAAKRAGIRLDQYYGVILVFNIAVGAPQGGAWTGGLPARGVFCDWRYVWANGTETFGQEMGFGYGLDASRQDGSTEDYRDMWDGMSAGKTFWARDPNYAARGPGLNAWNMRGRRWLDESRVWHAPRQSFSQVLQLRPLHRRDLPGALAAELPPFDGPDGHSRYLVEFRAKEGWDSAIPRSAILVHRFEGGIKQFLGSHSYLMSGTKGQPDLVAGDEFTSQGAGQPDLRVEVLSIDDYQRLATVRLTYVPQTLAVRAAAPQPKVAVTGGSTRSPSLDQPLPPPQTNAPAKLIVQLSAITNGPAVFVPDKLVADPTNLVFDHFLCNSLNNLIWTNVIANTNGRSTQIWSTRLHPAGWPNVAPVVTWDTNSLMWGMTGLTALSPCWEGEGNPGQVPVTALSRRHGYTRGHSMGQNGFTTNFTGMKVWFVAADNTLIQATVAQAVVRTSLTTMTSSGTWQDYTLLLFKEELPLAIQPLRVLAVTNRVAKYPTCKSAPCPLFQTEQGGYVSANLPGLTVNTFKGGDSGSPDMLPMDGELVFCEGRSTSGPSPEMQADMDELCRIEGLDPMPYQLQWLDVSAFPSY